MRENDIFIDRFMRFLKEERVFPTSFEDECEIRRGTLSSAKSSKDANKSTGNLSFENIKKIMFHRRDINPYWLILGEGSPKLPTGISLASEPAGTYTTACPQCTHLSTENELLRKTIADKELIIQLLQKQIKNEENNPSPPAAD